MRPIQRGMKGEVQGKVEIHNSTNFISGFSGHRVVLHIVQTNGIIARYLSWSWVNTPTKTVILINFISSHKTQLFMPRETQDMKISWLHGYLFSVDETESLVKLKEKIGVHLLRLITKKMSISICCTGQFPCSHVK